MKIIYYTDPSGTVTGCHTVPAQLRDGGLEEAVETYNKNKGGEKVAHIEELVEGSLLAYVYDMADREIRNHKGAIRAAMEAIDEARSCVSALEDAL